MLPDTDHGHRCDATQDAAHLGDHTNGPSTVAVQDGQNSAICALNGRGIGLYRLLFSKNDNVVFYLDKGRVQNKPYIPEVEERIRGQRYFHQAMWNLTCATMLWVFSKSPFNPSFPELLLFLKWSCFAGGVMCMLRFLVPLVVIISKTFRMGWSIRRNPDYARHHQPRLLFDTPDLADRTRRCLVDGHILLCLPRGRQVDACALHMWLRDLGWTLQFASKRMMASKVYRREMWSFRRAARKANGQSWLPCSPDYRNENVHRRSGLETRWTGTMTADPENGLDGRLLFMEICLDHTSCEGIHTWFDPAERTHGKE